ncbi:MAG: protein kinase, partial [Planctomycetota bacterium]
MSSAHGNLSKSDLLDHLRQSDLMSSEQFRQAERLCSRVNSTESLLEQLIVEKLATRWQIEELKLGRRSFELEEFVLEDRIGGGATGEVFQAAHRESGKRFAIKILASRLASNQELVARFRQEIRILETLSHPCIVKCFGARQAGGVEIMVMELARGSDLEKQISIGRARTFSEKLTCEIGALAASGLNALAEHGLVHRDIKPSNLIVWSNRETRSLQLRIVDFGLVHDSSGNALGLTADQAILGSLDFMAPEQLENASSVDVRADIFSLGATLSFALTGKRLTNASSLAERISQRLTQNPPSILENLPDCMPELAETIDRCLMPDPKHRFQDAKQLALALRRLAARLPNAPHQAIRPLPTRSPAPVSENAVDTAIVKRSHQSTLPMAAVAELKNIESIHKSPSSPRKRIQFCEDPPRPVSAKVYAFIACCSVIFGLIVCYFSQGGIEIAWPRSQRESGSRLTINGKDYPLAEHGKTIVRLSRGKHMVLLERPGYLKDRQEIDVAWGSRVEVEPNWRPNQDLRAYRTLATNLAAWPTHLGKPAYDRSVVKIRDQLFGLQRSFLKESQLPVAERLIEQLPSPGEIRLVDSIGSSVPPGTWSLGQQSFRHSGKVTATVFQPDGLLLATAGEDGRVLVWAMSDGGLVKKRQSDSAVTVIRFLNSTTLAIGETSGVVVTWDFEAGKEFRYVSGLNPVTVIGCSGDGKRVAAGSSDGDLRIWKVNDADPERVLALEHQPLAMAWSNDGKACAVNTTNGETQLVRIGQNTPVQLPNAGPAASMYFTNGGDLVALGSNRQQYTWHSDMWELTKSPAPSHIVAASDGSWRIESTRVGR